MDSERGNVTSLFGGLNINIEAAAGRIASVRVEIVENKATSGTSSNTTPLTEPGKTTSPVATQLPKHIPAPTPQHPLPLKTSTLPLTTKTTSKPLTSFHHFPLLPGELRIQIWTPILTTSPPSILRANYDAYTQHFRNGNPNNPFYNPHGGDCVGTWKLTARTTPLLSICQESRFLAEKDGYERVHLARDVTQRRWFNFRNGEVWFTRNAVPHTYQGDEPRVAPPLEFPFSGRLADRFKVVGVCKMLWNDWPFMGEYQYSWYWESDKEDPDDEGKQPQEDLRAAIKQFKSLQKFKLMLHRPWKYFRWEEDYCYDDNDSEYEIERGLRIMNEDCYWSERKGLAITKPEISIVELKELQVRANGAA
ncbi:hypothetical protein DL98DRAFT_584556 [Cadophora sp. DSE1049]|nr:hypothetical protein DL98DRAFT_584556 [Cadophora sp. DSE1049]